MRFADMKVEYIPPSKAVLPLLTGKKSSSIPDYLLSEHPDRVKVTLSRYVPSNFLYVIKTGFSAM